MRHTLLRFAIIAAPFLAVLVAATTAIALGAQTTPTVLLAALALWMLGIGLMVALDPQLEVNRRFTVIDETEPRRAKKPTKGRGVEKAPR